MLPSVAELACPIGDALRQTPFGGRPTSCAISPTADPLAEIQLSMSGRDILLHSARNRRSGPIAPHNHAPAVVQQDGERLWLGVAGEGSGRFVERLEDRAKIRCRWCVATRAQAEVMTVIHEDFITVFTRVPASLRACDAAGVTL